MTETAQQPTPAPFWPTNILGRWAVFFIGIFIMSLGVALSIHSGLGTAAISTLPTVLDAATGISVGTLTIVMNLCFILVQWAILRKKFQPFQFLQVFAAIAYGLLIDFSVWLTDGLVNPQNYLTQWCWSIMGAIILGIGVYFQVRPKLIYLPADGVVAALDQVTKVRFGTLKQMFDWSLVIISAILSLVLMGRLAGVREGTVFNAFAVGAVVKLMEKMVSRVRNRKRYA